MLNFSIYNDTVYLIQQSEVKDDWGISVLQNTKIPVPCRCVESVESIKLMGEKSENYITKYIISFPSDVDVKYGDKIVINDVSFNIAKLSKSRDLSGNIMASKVWV